MGANGKRHVITHWLRMGMPAQAGAPWKRLMAGGPESPISPTGAQSDIARWRWNGLVSRVIARSRCGACPPLCPHCLANP